MARKQYDIDMQDVADAEGEPSRPPVLSDQDIAERMHRLNMEYQDYRGDTSGAALARRSEITHELRTLRKLKIAKEPKVVVQVPRSPTGHPIQLGPKTFFPGAHTVTLSEAEELSWIIDQQQQAELRRMQQNGRTIDLSDPHARVRALLADE